MEYFFSSPCFDYSPVYWGGFCNYRRDVSWKSILNLDASIVTFEFVSGSIDELTHISHPINIKSNFIQLDGFQLLLLLS